MLEHLEALPEVNVCRPRNRISSLDGKSGQAKVSATRNVLSMIYRPALDASAKPSPRIR